MLSLTDEEAGYSGRDAMGSVNNEPVAIRYDFDGYGYRYMDSGSGSDWQSRVKGEPLYTHPHSEESVKVKELTDEEIMELSYMTSDNDPIAFVRAILRKAQGDGK
jgi:hypothetical protein